MRSDFVSKGEKSIPREVVIFRSARNERLASVSTAFLYGMVLLVSRPDRRRSTISARGPRWRWLAALLTRDCRLSATMLEVRSV